MSDTLQENTITMNTGSEEMIRVAKDGFMYVVFEFLRTIKKPWWS